MFNIFLDRLPTTWKGRAINTDFRIGIQMYQALYDSELTENEKTLVAIKLLFGKDAEFTDDNKKAVEWFLSDYNHDNHQNSESNKKFMDFDVDQWRIYSAFRAQYGIDLSIVRMHWFVFMGLLINLEDCNYLRVVDIRQKKITTKMSSEEKKTIRDAKKVYQLEEDVSIEQKQIDDEAVKHFRELIGKG